MTNAPDSSPTAEASNQAEASTQMAIVAPASMAEQEAPSAPISETATELEPEEVAKPTVDADTEETTSAVSPKTDLNNLLAKAQQRFAADKLSYPSSDSARFYYQAILQQEPGHPEATKGLDKIANRYADLAQIQINNGRTLKARRYLNQGLEIRPKSRRLIRMMNLLNRPVKPKSSADIFDRLAPENDR
jgi:hypothetical protein